MSQGTFYGIQPMDCHCRRRAFEFMFSRVYECRHCFDNSATNRVDSTAVVASWVVVDVMQNNVGISSFPILLEVHRG